MLVGTTSFAIVGGFQLTDIRSAQAAESEWLLEVLEELAVPIFGEDFRTESVIIIPAVFRLVPKSPRRVTVKIQFDSRVFQLADNAWVTRGMATLQRARVMDVRDAGGGTSSAQIELGEVDATGIRVHLPIRAIDLYPNENVGTIANLTVTATDSNGPDRHASFVWAALPPSPVVAWGASLAAGWGSTGIEESSKSLNYRYPVRVKCTSVGPEAIPAGSTITLSADQRVIAGFEVNSAAINDTAVAGEGLTSQAAPEAGRALLRIKLVAPLAAGEVFDITVGATAVANAPQITDVTYATVNFTGSDVSSGRLRATGSLALAPITSSGTPAAPHAAIGRI